MPSKVCKICAGAVKTIHDGKNGYDYYACHQCGFIFLDEIHVLPPEKERERYLLHVNTPTDLGYVSMLTQFIEKSIIPFHPRIHRALDFGSGPEPVLAELLKKMGYTVDIYDVYFAPQNAFLNHTYDLISCTEVVEHLQNPLEVLTLFKELLNPGGILAIKTQFHPLKFSHPETFLHWWYRRDATHISFFNPETFRYISQILDLQVMMMDSINTVCFQKNVDN